MEKSTKPAYYAFCGYTNCDRPIGPSVCGGEELAKRLDLYNTDMDRVYHTTVLPFDTLEAAVAQVRRWAREDKEELDELRRDRERSDFYAVKSN